MEGSKAFLNKTETRADGSENETRKTSEETSRQTNTIIQGDESFVTALRSSNLG